MEHQCSILNAFAVYLYFPQNTKTEGPYLSTDLSWWNSLQHTGHWFVVPMQKKEQTLIFFYPFALAPAGPLRGLECWEAGRHLWSCNRCHNGHMINKLHD